MATTSMIWDGNKNAGGLGDCGPYAEATFALLFGALVGGRSGVMSGCAVTESVPRAASVTVAPGSAFVRGHFYQADAGTILTIAANSSGNPRIDRVVLRANWTSKQIRSEILIGTPDVSPVAPSLIQIDGAIWDVPLAQVAVANGFSIIEATNITRERLWVRPDYPGKLEPLVLETPPAGWLLCDGSAVSRTTYLDLFDALGTTFGVGDGSTTFNLPDLRGRTLIGLDNMGGSSANVVAAAAADTLGGIGGAETHTLTTTELPAHAHNQAANTVRALSGGDRQTPTGGTINYSSATAATANAGGGEAHNNMPPYLALNWMIRT